MPAIPKHSIPPEPISYGTWVQQWTDYRAAVASKGKSRVAYGVGTRRPGGVVDMWAGPYPKLTQALAEIGGSGDVIVELNGNAKPDRVLYKWKNGEWFQKAKP